MFLINLNSTNKAIKITLSLALMVFVLTMTPASTFVQITKPAEAAPLTSVKISPTNNIVNTRTTYDIFFVTATTGTIKFIQMTFPSGSSVDTATLIERSGIGTGSISTPSANQVIYSVTNPVSVPAGTTIRLQIAKIANSNTEDDTSRLSITTQDANNAVIDGPTNSFSFPIKAINGNDVSPAFMKSKTLNDDDPGNAQGWDPNDVDDAFLILDSEINSQSRVIVNTAGTGGTVCSTSGIGGSGGFIVNCDRPVVSLAKLHYTIINNLPVNVVTSSLSESSSPFDSSQGSQNLFPPSLP